MAGFFEEPEQRVTSTTPNNFDIGAAKFLHKHLLEARLLQAPAKTKVWADHFRVLRKTIPPQRIAAVLKWYVKNLKKEYMPQAYSARGFKDRFIQIELAMGRGADPRVSVITDECRKLDAVTNLYWPPSVTKDDVLYVAQASLTAYAEFRAALAAVAADPAVAKQDQGLVAYFRSYTHPIVPVYIDLYLYDIHRAVHRLAGWEGSLRGWVWRPNRRAYRNKMWTYAADFTGYPDAFDRVLELIKGR